MRFTAVVIPAGAEGNTVIIPALPGCVSEGNTREEALDNAAEAALAWLAAEATRGRGPIQESATLLAEATSEALKILEEMRAAGEVPLSLGFPLELVALELPHAAPV